jgi:uncharacterized protein Usg
VLACADGRENKAVTAQLRTIAHNVAGRIWRKFDLKPHLIGIRKWIEHWNDNPGPFASTKTAEDPQLTGRISVEDFRRAH